MFIFYSERLLRLVIKNMRTRINSIFIIINMCIDTIYHLCMHYNGNNLTNIIISQLQTQLNKFLRNN